MTDRERAMRADLIRSRTEVGRMRPVVDAAVEWHEGADEVTAEALAKSVEAYKELT